MRDCLVSFCPPHKLIDDRALALTICLLSVEVRTVCARHSLLGQNFVAREGVSLGVVGAYTVWVPDGLVRLMGVNLSVLEKSLDI